MRKQGLVAPEELLSASIDGRDGYRPVGETSIKRKVNKVTLFLARFGEIIQAGGKRKDEEFGDQILSFDFSSDNEASR